MITIEYYLYSHRRFSILRYRTLDRALIIETERLKFIFFTFFEKHVSTIGDSITGNYLQLSSYLVEESAFRTIALRCHLKSFYPRGEE